MGNHWLNEEEENKHPDISDSKNSLFAHYEQWCKEFGLDKEDELVTSMVSEINKEIERQIKNPEMTKRTFEIEYEAVNGPLWMNKSNLLICLTNTCGNSKFTVKDITGDQCDPSPESAGPVNPGRLIRRLDAVVAAVAGGWCTPRNSHKIMDPDLCEDIIDNVMKAIEEF